MSQFLNNNLYIPEDLSCLVCGVPVPQTEHWLWSKALMGDPDFAEQTRNYIVNWKLLEPLNLNSPAIVDEKRMICQECLGKHLNQMAEILGV